MNLWFHVIPLSEAGGKIFCADSIVRCFGTSPLSESLEMRDEMDGLSVMSSGGKRCDAASYGDTLMHGVL